MNIPSQPDQELEQRLATPLLDVLIRAGLILAMAMLCYQVFSPFLDLMVWALILAVTLYPLHQSLASKMGGKQGLAATLLVVLGDRADRRADRGADELARRFGASPGPRRAEQHAEDSGPASRGRGMAGGRQEGPRRLVEGPCGPAGAGAEPAAEDRRPGEGGPGLRRQHRRWTVAVLASFIIAGIIMAFGESGSRGSRRSSSASSATPAASEFASLSTATIRAVAQGVLGVAFIQAIIVGLALLVAGVPWAGVLAVIVLVLGIAQVPALLVTLPAIAYIWSSGDYGTGGGDRLHRGAVPGRHGGQRAEAADAWARGRCADAGHSARCAGRHGDRWHPGDVRRRHPADAGLSDLHGLGGGQSRTPGRRRRKATRRRRVVCPPAAWGAPRAVGAAPASSAVLGCPGWLKPNTDAASHGRYGHGFLALA